MPDRPSARQRLPDRRSTETFEFAVGSLRYTCSVGRFEDDRIDPPPLKWSDLRYVFDIKEDCNGKEAIQA
jgi:hypothetical protein